MQKLDLTTFKKQIQRDRPFLLQTSDRNNFGSEIERDREAPAFGRTRSAARS